ncbi:MAG: hypothetical protein KatS3mg028_0345 [Bacteroidia bacterium]|nr:MAG: hypothetical protein KatS3mg028_0345 [Bacteroidia bacterium]
MIVRIYTNQILINNCHQPTPLHLKIVGGKKQVNRIENKQSEQVLECLQMHGNC